MRIQLARERWGGVVRCQCCEPKRARLVDRACEGRVGSFALAAVCVCFGTATPSDVTAAARGRWATPEPAGRRVQEWLDAAVPCCKGVAPKVPHCSAPAAVCTWRQRHSSLQEYVPRDGSAKLDEPLLVCSYDSTPTTRRDTSTANSSLGRDFSSQPSAFSSILTSRRPHPHNRTRCAPNSGGRSRREMRRRVAARTGTVPTDRCCTHCPVTQYSKCGCQMILQCQGGCARACDSGAGPGIQAGSS
jgi:hypothetical protein